MKSLVNLAYCVDEDDSTTESPESKRPKLARKQSPCIDIVAAAKKYRKTETIPTPQQEPAHVVSDVEVDHDDDVESTLEMKPYEFTIEPDEVDASLFGVSDSVTETPICSRG